MVLKVFQRSSPNQRPTCGIKFTFWKRKKWSYCSPSSLWGVIKQSDIELSFSETDSNSSLRSHWTCQVRFKTDISVLFWLMFLKFEFEFDEFSHSLHKMPCILFLDECDFSSLVPFNVLKLKRWNTGLYFHIK